MCIIFFEYNTRLYFIFYFFIHNRICNCVDVSETLQVSSSELVFKFSYTVGVYNCKSINTNFKDGTDNGFKMLVYTTEDMYVLKQIIHQPKKALINEYYIC